ncbi:MAG: cytochrome c oxidase assembly factor Coa1 family protein [Winogradskyella sp.]|jgi:hypothetical protein
MEGYNRKSWFRRNWKWLLPVGGCLTLILMLMVLVGTLFFGVTRMFANSEPYQYALEQASTNEKVIAVMGEPIEKKGIVSGNMSLSDDDGEANFKLPIKGPKGEGSIVILAVKNYGEWTYEELYVQIEDSDEVINLLDKRAEEN